MLAIAATLVAPDLGARHLQVQHVRGEGRDQRAEEDDAEDEAGASMGPRLQSLQEISELPTCSHVLVLP